MRDDKWINGYATHILDKTGAAIDSYNDANGIGNGEIDCDGEGSSDASPAADITLENMIIGFEILDAHLNNCQKGECPGFINAQHHALINISLGCYITQKKYFLGQCKVGKNDDDRKEKVMEVIKKVFNCEKQAPDLNGIIDYDNNHLKNWKPCMQKRKAYWRYIKRRELNEIGNPQTDFDSSSAIAETIYNGNIGSEPINKYAFLWTSNADILHGVDLFRYCSHRCHTKERLSDS